MIVKSCQVILPWHRRSSYEPDAPARGVPQSPRWRVGLVCAKDAKLSCRGNKRAPETSSTSAIRSQTHGERLSLVASSTTSRHFLESPGRTARKPLIALTMAVIDLIRSSRLGSAEVMSLFLEKDHAHESMARDAHAVSRYTDRQGFSIRLSSTKGAKGRDPFPFFPRSRHYPGKKVSHPCTY